MYPWIWRHLPGPTWARAVESAVIVLVIVAVCFTWVFPALAPLLPFNDNSVH